ncbi:hypothetical protein Hz2V013 [Helicoverpa zea nudivirus 2]|uniref:Uncharacterized protein n=1 Tax=Helicoverpa zea nudivirus 2 TaxID=1128424 RepID=G9I039_HZNV2|nr:orf13 gene product [Helicoverpa zea nudivirus 2]AEW69562.1 hypothetical protein Hz2V013 [Helicoverpa zea nudivirus 2]
MSIQGGGCGADSSECNDCQFDKAGTGENVRRGQSCSTDAEPVLGSFEYTDCNPADTIAAGNIVDLKNVRYGSINTSVSSDCSEDSSNVYSNRATISATPVVIQDSEDEQFMDDSKSVHKGSFIEYRAISKNEYNQNEYNQNEYNQNEYNKNEYNQNEYNKNEYTSKNDYNSTMRRCKLHRVKRSIVESFESTDATPNVDVDAMERGRGASAIEKANTMDNSNKDGVVEESIVVVNGSTIDGSIVDGGTIDGGIIDTSNVIEASIIDVDSEVSQVNNTNTGSGNVGVESSNVESNNVERSNVETSNVDVNVDAESSNAEVDVDVDAEYTNNDDATNVGETTEDNTEYNTDETTNENTDENTTDDTDEHTDENTDENTNEDTDENTDETTEYNTEDYNSTDVNIDASRIETINTSGNCFVHFLLTDTRFLNYTLSMHASLIHIVYTCMYK